MHYALFLPNKSGANPEHLKSLGLGSLLRDGGPDFVEGKGPGDATGLFATWRWGASFKYRPENQVWKSLAANPPVGRSAGDCLIGWDTDSPPTPSDLELKQQYGGAFTRLRDGHTWLIAEAWKLPPHFDKDAASGEWIVRHAPEFADFCQRAESFAFELADLCDAVAQAQAANPGVKHHREMTVADTFDFACDALGLNYRVCPEIVAALGLLQRPEAVRVIGLAVGFVELMEEVSQKKTFEAERYIEDREIIAAFAGGES